MLGTAVAVVDQAKRPDHPEEKEEDDMTRNAHAWMKNAAVQMPQNSATSTFLVAIARMIATMGGSTTMPPGIARTRASPDVVLAFANWRSYESS